jgi:hypothetical protein
VAILLSLEDFDNNFFELAKTDNSEQILQDYITRYEKHYILKLLGVTYGTAWITAIAGTPSPADLYIKNEFYEQDEDDCDKVYHSRGMKEFLKAAIFFHYVKDTVATHSPSGVIAPDVETARVLSFENQTRYAEKKWNEALDTVDAIQWKCSENETDYPDYNGTKFKPEFSALL